MPDYELQLYGQHTFEFKLRRLGERAAKSRPALEKIGLRMLSDERRLFETGGRSGHTPWRPLAKDTRIAKAAAGYRQPSAPLIGTGDEMRSLSERGAPGNIFRVTDTYVIIGSSKPQVDLQMTGTRDMPARPPIQFTRLQQDSYLNILERFIFDGSLPRNA